jgi:beta-galactosidase
MLNKIQIVKCLFIISLFLGKNPAFAGERIPIHTGWAFLRGDLGHVWEAVRVPQKGQPTNFPVWSQVELPHCYNAFDAVDPLVCYYQGPAWYRNFIHIENPYPGGRTFLYFEGAGQKTEVYIGLEKAGSHVGGYDAWQVDITEALQRAKQSEYIQKNYNGLVPVSIRCDNSRDVEMIPSDLSDFHVYGGIYRPLYIVHRPNEWLETIKVTAALNERRNIGSVVLEPVFGNVSGKVKLHISVSDATGKSVFSKDDAYNGSPVVFDVRQPKLWSPSSPYLYTITVEAVFGDHAQVLSEKIGFRSFEFRKQGPFFLNSERLLLKGTHRHEDFAGVGAAETEEMLVAELKMMKAMGANFIRLGHYQQAKRILELCDSLGLLVWEEIPWCRGGLGGETYKEQARRMLCNMIEQHYNHPSVIFVGAGQRERLAGDFEEFDQDSIRAFMAELHKLSHDLDPTRLTAIRRCEFCKDIVDVYSPSIWPGWYRGRYTDYYRVTKYEKEHTDRFLHVEWGADSHVGRHDEQSEEIWKNFDPQEQVDPSVKLAQLYTPGKNYSKEGDWSESYAVELFDWTLTEQKRMPWLSGTAIWTFKDFATPIRPENPIPFVNQKGVVQRDLTAKEVFYVVQAHWSEEPMVHIYGHSWPVRWGKEGEPKTVKVYSNCDEAELFVNGISYGSKVRQKDIFPAMGLTWDVPLNEGVNHIKAVGKSKGKQITDELEWRYQVGAWGSVDRIILVEEAIDENTSFLKAVAVDANGKICLDSRLPVEFGVLGSARLHAMQGTATGSHIIQLSNGEGRIKMFKSGPFYSAAVKAEGLGWFPLKQD